MHEAEKKNKKKTKQTSCVVLNKTLQPNVCERQHSPQYKQTKEEQPYSALSLGTSTPGGAHWSPLRSRTDVRHACQRVEGPYVWLTAFDVYGPY